MHAAIIAHVWQSTLCVLAAWILTMFLRRHTARVRYLVWLAASLKFLLPFSALTALGLALRPADRPRMDFLPEGFVAGAASLAQVPFSAPGIASPIDAPSPTLGLNLLLLTVWVIGAAAVLAGWIVQWRRVAAAVHAAQRVPMDIPIEARISGAFAEPGIFGVFRPILLLPQKLLSRMSAAELEALIAHEMCHVRRRDNLAAAAHRLVAVLFWFHPLVWWIDRRLLEERERACDEDVIEHGTVPRIYAEGILKACHLSLESRLGVVARASSVNLKDRIKQIVTERRVQRLGPCATAGLLAAVGAVLMVPVSAGIATPRLPSAMAGAHRVAVARFEHVSVLRTPAKSRAPSRLLLERGRLSMRNTSLRQLISVAYGTGESRVFGGPYWLDDRYDIEAGTSRPTSADIESTQRQMILRLLTDRFELKFVEFGAGASG